MEELPPQYNPGETEGKIYKLWEESGYFNPDNLPDAEKREPFTISLPPPNVTGTLHIGHAFEDTIQDAVIRYRRMQGRRALWVPGTDHAPIATESKVVKIIEKEEGKRKQDLGREEFVQRVNDFANESHDTIVSQIRLMGASCDWSREAYTFDEERSLAVRTAFKKMYDAGLIYRGYRVVNWDPKGQTVISDDEVVHVERPAKLYTFKYSADFPISISTTRPETKLGDTAVAVHPDDERYMKFIGQEFETDFCGEKIHLKIIADEGVDREFGTGALGVTPAHSMSDFELSQKYGLPLKQIINEYGRMMVGNKNVKDKKTEEARTEVIEWLKEQKLLEKEEDITQNVATAERTGGIIEPLPKLQWFVGVNKEFKADTDKLNGIGRGQEITLKDLMRTVVSSGQIKIGPERFEKIYFHWIENLRDWCISRQLWFGHRIPVWYCKASSIKRQASCENPIASVAPITSCPNCGGETEQDPDTLDTWFSSGLWTFSTLGWPAKKEWDLKIYGEKIFEGLKNGTKKIEVRAGKPEGAEKYWGDFKSGDIIAFRLADEKTDKVLENVEPVIKMVSKVEHFDSLNSLFEKYPAESDYPGENKEAVVRWWKAHPEMWERIEKYGAWVFELKNRDLEVYHPTSVMMPGYEILFFWGARMILMSGFLLGEIPFHRVSLHGMVRDKLGRKFSKSLNNGVDPNEMIEKYGADALRMALVFGSAPGNDLAFDEQRVRGMKHFANKLWNISRFVLTNLENHNKQITNNKLPDSKTDADHEILLKLEETKNNVTKNLENYQLHEAAQSIYQFTWREFADVYIEKSKAQLKNSEAENTKLILRHVLKSTLKLLHPFMPFVTEEIWQKISPGKLLIIENW